MLMILLLGLHLQSSWGFRGPHHPQSSVSHHHYAPQADVKLTHDSQLLHDTAHLAEDMNNLGEHLDLSKMSEEELDFYYFKSHDVDNNTKLDGLEMLYAIQHTFHEDDIHETDDSIPLIVDLIDRVLEEDDLDNDGYLGYAEYVLSRQSSERPKNLKLDIK
ncbi:multiple coagulation factor deficiency protein 2 homolog [Chelonus insularis]|uniref:multiple coagulation factor deficiency protein 2 homolog n=1 Tax=Chelonus insularis TaxID=460826 RepID=UPI00158BD56B|nr:multiple coagulation factor deficiency protein 2 homolog [Chelonus insularis]XP_034943459.1 multiple coagulation factor deficiency protein 2 homolog [Chelonus insularis]